MITLNNGQENDNNEKEEGDVEKDTVCLVVVAIWWSNFITDTTTGSHTLGEKEEKLKDINDYLPIVLFK